MSDRNTWHDGGVLQCSVATEHSRGTLDIDTIRAATTAIEAAANAEGDQLGAVLLVGSRSSFCTGGDVKSFAAAADRGAFIGGLARDLHRFILALTEAPVPVVAAVRGWAAGAGMSIVCAADIAVGGPATKFRPAYPSVGLSPDGGMSWTLPRIIGTSRARDLILTDGVLGADEAHRAGLLTRFVPDEEIVPHALELAGQLARGPRSTYGRIKRLLARSGERNLTEQLDAEAAAIAVCADSTAGREGVDAFVNHRQPRFDVQRAEPAPSAS